MSVAPRRDAATALRQLSHLFVGRDLTDEQLVELTDVVTAWIQRADEQPVRVREFPADRIRAWQEGVSLPEGARPTGFPDSVVTGDSNPMGLAARQWNEGEVAYAEATFDRAFEGAPGRGHGGILAALLDETMGRIPAIFGSLAFTGRLEISYRSPTPLYRPIMAKAWCTRREGRKFHIHAEIHDGETLVAEATALFIAVDLSKFLPSS